LKILKKIKLVNWHYFVNETLTIEGNTLITGENGSGKSTILDAIQYVLSPGKQKFNIAANDGTKRTVNAYVRGKLGRSNKKYLREGDVSSHVALEYLDTRTGEYFVIGTVLDSVDTLSPPKYTFYEFDGMRISDELFIDGNLPLNINEFKKKHRGANFRTVNTLKAARKQLAMRFNITDYNYFELLPKALAFKPINNVKDFIYSYILEEKNLDIEYLVGNIRTYKEFINILEDVNDKLSSLEEIENTYQSIVKIEEKFKIVLYAYMRTQIDELEGSVQATETSRKQYEQKLSLLNEEKRVLKTELNAITSKRDDIHLSLLVDDDYKLLNRLNTEKDDLSGKISSYDSVNTKIDEIIKDEFSRAKSLLKQGYVSKAIDKFLEYEKEELDLFNINEFVDVLSDYYSFVIKTQNQVSEKRVHEVVRKEITEENLAKLHKDIKILNEKKVLIPNDVVDFRAELEKQLIDKGHNTTPVILCEVLEINDKRWQNAIEGYLGKDRFNVFVNPKYFKDALKIYKKIRKKYKRFSVSLVNTEKLSKYDKITDGSLASEISTTYKYARLYINYRLNNLAMCEKVEDLPKHKQAVTPDCIIYSRYVVTELNKKNYARLYIGSDAHKKQLDQANELIDNEKKALVEHKKNITKFDDLIEMLSIHNLSYVKDRIDIKIETFTKTKTLGELSETISSLEKSTVSDKETMMKKLEEDYEKANSRLEQITEETSVLSHKLSELVTDDEIAKEISEEKQKLADYEIEISGFINDAKKEYTRIVEENKDNRFLNKTLELTLRDREKEFTSAQNDLILLQRFYNRKFNFEGTEGLVGMDDFFEEQRRLKTSHLVQYEEKVFESKRLSESELKEHFVFRLNESLQEAKTQFEDLNKSLENIRFGNDEYQFVFKPNPRFSEYYDMLTDSANFIEDTEGFSKSFIKKHGKTLDKLMDFIVREDINENFLEEIVDYRTYMDYDIKIIHSEGSISLLSEISREKSGGETQIPYYVAMASTFIKIYQSNNVNSDSMGIVLFDEAFDKIDSTRTDAMMTFLSNLGLQVIISTPPQKVEDIYPFVDSTIVVSRQGEKSWIFGLNKAQLDEKYKEA